MVHFAPTEVTIPHIAYACLGGFVVIFGMFSLFIRERLYIGEACWAFLFGVIIGPYGANVFDPRSWGNHSEEITNEITLEFTRVVLAVGVFAIGVELPKAYMKRHWKSLFFLLFPVMTWGWFVSAAFIYALIPKLSFLASLAIAACLTPTDPILAAAVVGGKYADKHVPAHLRHLLAAESGCNDGAAFPFLYIALYLILDVRTDTAIKDWFLILWLYEVILGTVFGTIIGISFRYLMKFCEKHDLVDRQSYVAQYVSLALFTIGVTALIGSDDLLAAFACGTAFAWDGFFNKQTEASVFSSVIDLLFNIAAFVFVGAWTPFSEFTQPELSISVWRLVVIAILVLIFRRLPIMLLVYKWIPDVKNWREAVFSGHFGPMGIGAIFISTLAMGELPTVEGEPKTDAEMVAATIQPIVAFMVVVSIIIHGLSIPFFSLGRRVHTMTRTYTGTRTWSRQPSLPEWANQTRQVERAEDIVINRDPSAAERGELPAEKEKIVEGNDPAVPGDDTAREKEKIISGSSSASATGVSTPSGSEDDKALAEKDARRDAKGEEIAASPQPGEKEHEVMEWKEGPHKIIERRNTDDEVEVTVEKNAFGPGESETLKRLFPRHNFDGRKAAHALLTGITDAAEHAFKDAEHKVEGASKHAKHSAGTTMHATEDALHRVTSGGGEEEGWASDRSDASPEGSEREGRKKKKVLRPPQVHVQGRPRRRFSHLKSSRPAPLPPSGHVQHSPRMSQGSAVDEAEGDITDARRRGRSADGPPKIGAPRISHPRIDSLRDIPSRGREASPARSVRFADEDAPSVRSPLSPAGSYGSRQASDDEGGREA